MLIMELFLIIVFFTVPSKQNGVSIQVIASSLNFSLTISENWIGGFRPSLLEQLYGNCKYQY